MADTTIGIQAALEKLKRGDTKARDELIGLACRRMTALTQPGYAGNPAIGHSAVPTPCRVISSTAARACLGFMTQLR